VRLPGIAALLAAAAAAAAACGDAAGGGGAIAPGTTYAVRRGPLRITVSETGTLKAKNSVNIKARIPGTARVVWLVPEGTAVKEGDKLAELDKTEVQKNIDSLESQLTQNDSERKTAKTEYEIQKADGKAAVEKAQLTLDIRKSEMARYLENEAPAGREKRALGVQKAESEYARRKERYEQMKALLDRDFVTASQVEEERIAMLSSELALREAKDQYDVYEKYTADIEKREKESALAEAVRGLENETLRAESLLDRRKVQYEQAERRYVTTDQKLREAREQFDAMTVKAPAPGIVIYNDRGQNDELKVGSTVYNEQPFLQLPDLAEMEVTLGIHEADVTKLRAGQEAFVTLDAFKGRRLAARIVSIATFASERDWRSDIRKFEVVLSLEKNDLPLKPGATVKTEVLVGEVDGVLAVPLQSVFVKEGKYYCFADAGGSPERREVTLGESNASFVEVKEGVREGDAVLLWNPEGAEASPSEARGAGDRGKREGGGNGTPGAGGEKAGGGTGGASPAAPAGRGGKP
jgi:RND family efflux transporter MFP subunit